MSKKAGSSAAVPDMQSEVGVSTKLENDIFHVRVSLQLQSSYMNCKSINFTFSMLRTHN